MSKLTIDQIIAIRKLSKNDIDFARDIEEFVTNESQAKIGDLENRLEGSQARVAEWEKHCAYLNDMYETLADIHEDIAQSQSPAPVSETPSPTDIFCSSCGLTRADSELLARQPTLAAPPHSEQQEPIEQVKIEWVSVKDRLPAHGQEVMCRSDNGEWREKFDSNEPLGFMTHWRDDDPVCPKCGSQEVFHKHYSGDAVIPECDYYECDICSKQFGHE